MVSNLFSYSFDEDILTEPMIFTFSDKNTKIGINSSKEYKLFLFDYNGDLVSGFPLSGNTQFSIGSFDNSTNYELITGCNENFILKYSIKK